MRLIGTILVSFFLLGACTPSKKKQQKEQALSQEQLIPLLYDTYLYEGALKAHALDSAYGELQVIEFYDAILKKHQINREDAQQTLEYLAREKELIPILEKVKSQIKEKKKSKK